MTEDEIKQVQKAIKHIDSFRYRIPTGINPPSKHIAVAQEILEELLKAASRANEK